MAVTTVYPSDPSGMAPHTVLDPGKGMAGSFVWQKLKLLKALTTYFRDKGVGWWEQAFVKDWRNGTNECS